MLRLAKFLRAISWRQWFSAFDRLLQADGFLGNETAFVVKNAVPVFPLTDSTAIRLATEQTRVAWAGSLQASAPYDLNFTTSFTSVTSRSPVQVPGAVASLPDVSALKQLDYSVGLSLQLSPSVTVQRIDLSTTPGAPVARSTVALNALVPLLRDRAALNLRASGEVADAEVLASEDDRRHATAVALQSVAAAYWTWEGCGDSPRSRPPRRGPSTRWR